MSKILQYELWQECNNFCDYCTLGHNITKTSDKMKLQALTTTIIELLNLKKGEVSTLGFIGGEFFQGQLHNPEVKRAFMTLIDLSNCMLIEGDINELWLNATLTIGDQKDLYEAINKIEQKNKLWILTSYDIIGRFHTFNMLKNWEKHMALIHKKYPEVRINTTSILTGSFIQAYLRDDIDIHAFEQKYDTHVFFKTPVKPDDKCNMTRAEINNEMGYDFFPTRMEFMQFLLKYREREGLESYQNLFSNDLKAEELHKNFNDESLRNVVFHRSSDFKEELDCDKSLKEIELLPCGHSNVYQCYSDHDGCAICDKKVVLAL